MPNPNRTKPIPRQCKTTLSTCVHVKVEVPLRNGLQPLWDSEASSWLSQACLGVGLLMVSTVRSSRAAWDLGPRKITPALSKAPGKGFGATDFGNSPCHESLAPGSDAATLEKEFSRYPCKRMAPGHPESQKCAPSRPAARETALSGQAAIPDAAMARVKQRGLAHRPCRQNVKGSEGPLPAGASSPSPC